MLVGPAINAALDPMKNVTRWLGLVAISCCSHLIYGCGTPEEPLGARRGSDGETGGAGSHPGSAGGRGDNATTSTGSGGSSSGATTGSGGTGGQGGTAGHGGGGPATGTGATGGAAGRGGTGGTTGSAGSAGQGGAGATGGTGSGNAGNSGTTGGQGGASTGGTAGSGGATTGNGGIGGTAGSAAGSAGAGGGGAGGATGGAGGSADAGGTDGTLHFVVYGDTRTGSATHQRVVDQIAKLNPDLVVHSGDLWDGYTQAQFTTILTKNANIAALLTNGLYVVSRGNHETVTDYLAFKPSLSRGNATERFSYAVGNSYFVVLGMDPSGAASFLETELKKPEAMAARWRFVQSHYPIYSGGTTHGASGIPSIEKLCDTYRVAVYWAGHDHIYERSHQVCGGQVADTGDALSVSKGTVYVVSGGGGAPLYGIAKIATTHIQASTNNYVDVVAAPTTLTVKAYKLDGSQLDSFTIAQ